MRKIETTLGRRLFCALAPLAVFLTGCGGGGADGAPGADEVPIRIVDFAGLQEAVDGYRGHGLLLNFWAIWCGPCVAELPELLEVAREFHAEGGRVLSVSYDLMVQGADADTIEATMRDFIVSRDFAMPVLVYDDVDLSQVDELYSLPGPIPVTLAFDAEGKLVDRQETKADKARFEAMMRKALGK